MKQVMHQAGFTLIEMLVIIAVSAVVGLMTMQAFINLNRNFTNQNAIIDTQGKARNAMRLMTRVLRETGLDPLGTAGAGVEEARPGKVRISRDNNLDGAVGETLFERYSFAYDAGHGILSRGYYEGTASEAWTDMCNSVSGLTFTYLDENEADLGIPGTDFDQLARIRSVVVNLTFTDQKVGGGTFSRTLTTQVRCRNL